MGFAAAAPAATTAFGSTAFWAGTAAALPVSSAVVMPSIFTTAATAGGGMASSGFFNSALNFGRGLLADVNLMDVAFGASQLLSSYQTVRQGRYESDIYKLQANQKLAELEQKRLNFELDGLEKLRKLKRIQAANLARAYAGGVSGLDGSALLNDIVSSKEYGADYKIDLLNIKNNILAGEAQIRMDYAAADYTKSGSYLDAAAKLGEGAYLYSRLGGPEA
jgi:hypothetical protein